MTTIPSQLFTQKRNSMYNTSTAIILTSVLPVSFTSLPNILNSIALFFVSFYSFRRLKCLDDYNQKLMRLLIPSRPLCSFTYSAAITAPSAKPLRLCASWVMVIVSASES